MILVTFVCAALVALLTGCAASKEKQAAQQQIKILPADRVSAVKPMGKVYFAFPDQARKLLYVGNNNQYLHYQGLANKAQERMQVKYEMEALNRSQASPGWEAPWGDWDVQ